MRMVDNGDHNTQIALIKAHLTMTTDLSMLLPLSEMSKSRRAAAFVRWVDATCEAIAAVPEAREPALMHIRPFKEFYEEIFPLSRFVARCYADRQDVVITPNLDNRSFDAVIRDCSTSPPAELFVEITSARDPDEHLRMEYLVRYCHVSLWSPLTAQGKKRSRKITIEPEAVEHRELVMRHCEWIKTAAEGKASKSDHYGSSHVLLIAFDDGFRPTEADIATINAFVEKHVLPLSLNFAALHLIGLTGKTLRSFPLVPGRPGGAGLTGQSADADGE